MMKFNRALKLASYNSYYRGIDYVRENKVKLIVPISETKYKIIVEGSRDNEYEVILNTEQIRKSTCTCPHCDGHSSRFCKHKVAAYFTVYKDEYLEVLTEIEAREKEQERLELEYDNKVDKINKKVKKKVSDKINNMTQEEIKKALYQYMYNELFEIEIKDLDAEYEFDDESWY